eukprot:m.168698 g.168698  ORF g.168698 m.168698 type:complete len:165 (-) comp10356_c0_seq6:1229-1723(-)
MYIGSFLFEVPSTAFTRLTLFNVITGLAAMLTISILGVIKPHVANELKTAFLFLPSYCFGQGIFDLWTNYDSAKLCDQFDMPLETCCGMSFGSITIECKANYLAWESPGIGSYVYCMWLQAVAFFSIVLLIESRLLMRVVVWIGKACWYCWQDTKKTDSSMLLP